MDTQERAIRGRAGGSSAAPGRWMERTGWVRCQVMGRPAQLWTRVRPDTDPRAEATSRLEDPSMLKKAKHRASAILAGSAELYREIALSALRLVRR